jgi:phage shock protein A
MSVWSRIGLSMRIKSHAALEGLDDPAETLNFAESEQRRVLHVVGRGLIDVATARQQLVRQADRLEAQIAALDDRAKQAIDADREDLARASLERKQVAVRELDELRRQAADLEGEERTLTAAHQQLATRVEEFRIRRIATTAQYAAASSRIMVSDALAGVSGDLAELSMAVGRAEERTDRLRAQATAIDVLLSSGALAGPFGSTDRVERELRDLATAKAVDAELEALKAARMV